MLDFRTLWSDRPSLVPSVDTILKTVPSLKDPPTKRIRDPEAATAHCRLQPTGQRRQGLHQEHKAQCGMLRLSHNSCGHKAHRALGLGYFVLRNLKGLWLCGVRGDHPTEQEHITYE